MANTPRGFRHPLEAPVSLSRNTACLAVSAILLAGFMVAWPALFLWTKVSQFSALEQLLWSMTMRLSNVLGIVPIPFFAGSIPAAIGLIPAAFLTDSWPSARRAMLIAVVISPVAPLLVYASDSSRWRADLPLNMAFQYGWIVLFNLLFPALLLGGLRKLGTHIRSRRRSAP